MDTVDMNSPDDLALADRMKDGREKIIRELKKLIVGQDDIINQVLLTLFVGGNSLIVGVPGLAKTLLIHTMARVLDLKFSRIQFTPDLMPSDITGTDIIQEDAATGRRQMVFSPGPIFANIVLADEINRTPPKTQSALLEAMQEHRVTIQGRTYKLEEPFFVFATQNPIELEGTYPLPEAQLDRFLLQVDVTYPDIDAERHMLHATTGSSEVKPTAAMTADQFESAQRLVRRIPVGDKVVESILTLVRNGRPESSSLEQVRKHVAWGPGPRASQALMLAARARALMDGRLSPSAEDVLALAAPVLRHRMALNFSARADGVTLDSVIALLCQPLT